MGLDADCVARYGGKESSGRAYLGSDVIRFRGAFRLEIPFQDIHAVEAQRGELAVRHRDGEVTLLLGKAAESWALKIRYPKPLIDKLGVKADSKVAILNVDDSGFLDQVRLRTSDIAVGRSPNGTDIIFLGLGAPAELPRIAKVQRAMAPNGALWTVYPKGRKDITEANVRSAALAAGLVDTKVVGFSSTHTALRWVIPLERRVATKTAATKSVRARSSRQRLDAPAPSSRKNASHGKGRLFLFHWNADEAEELAAPLRADGWSVEIESADGARGGKRVVAEPPDAVVVYLTRLPSHGRETAHALRSFKATRTVPIVFVGGEGEQLAKTKAKVPVATYTTAGRLKRVLARHAREAGAGDRRASV